MSDRNRFDKFTERSRKVLSLAQEEAQRFQHNYIGTEHILIALVREGQGVAAKILDNMGLTVGQLRRTTETIVGRGESITLGEIRLTADAKKAIEMAVEEAHRLNHPYIGTEHLLLGLTRIPVAENKAGQILQHLGVSFETISSMTHEVLSNVKAQSQHPSSPSDLDLPVFGDLVASPAQHLAFNSELLAVLGFAREEAGRFQHNYIGTEHLLLGLVREDEGVAAKVLANLGVELNQVQNAVEFIIGRGDRIVLGEIGLTPRARKVIELAIDEARRLNHHYIGTEHLLLGLVREGEGIGAGVLDSLGITLEKARIQTIQVLSNMPPHTDQPPSASWQYGYRSTSQSQHIPYPTSNPNPIKIGNTVESLSQNPAFSSELLRVLGSAQKEAEQFQHNYIGTEHLLLGLMHDTEGNATKVLNNLGVELSKVRSAVEFIIGRGDRIVTGGMAEVGFTPRSRKVLSLTSDFAYSLKSDTMKPEHLLLGLVYEGEGIACGVLESLGVERANVYRETLLVLGKE